jgi:hypothetical protein
LTDRIGAIEWLRDRPSQQIPDCAMIARVAIAVHASRAIDVCGTIQVKLMINLSKINTINWLLTN